MKTKLLFLYFFFFAVQAYSQSLVRLMDLVVIPAETSGQHKDTLEFVITFKINKVSEGCKASVLLGSGKDLSEVKKISFSFINRKGHLFTDYGNMQEEVKNYQAAIRVKLAKNATLNWKTTTLFVTDELGLISNKLYL